MPPSARSQIQRARRCDGWLKSGANHRSSNGGCGGGTSSNMVSKFPDHQRRSLKWCPCGIELRIDIHELKALERPAEVCPPPPCRLRKTRDNKGRHAAGDANVVRAVHS